MFLFRFVVYIVLLLLMLLIGTIVHIKLFGTPLNVVEWVYYNILIAFVWNATNLTDIIMEWIYGKDEVSKKD